MNKQKTRPDWAKRAESVEYKPNWVGIEDHIVPTELWELGEVFFPLPRRKKAWKYPHHQQSHRYKPTDELFNAYIESGCGYGIACANDLVVIDLDDLDIVDRVVKKLPETLWQYSGSREGIHIFFRCEELTDRRTLFLEYLGEKIHVGEVKCDPNGYVVGPGSVHPSGNKYGPLQGNSIAKVSDDIILEALDEFIMENDDEVTFYDIEERYESQGQHEFYTIDADDVMPWLEPGKRIEHPGHGSSTWEETNGSIGNFMKNEDRETFTCWRHTYGSGQGCGLNPLQFLAQVETMRECDDVRRNWSSEYSLHYHAWKQAVKRDLVGIRDIPYNVLKGYAELHDIIDNSEKLEGDKYWDVWNRIKIEEEKSKINFEQYK